jgi:hypothetical protein
MQSSRVLLGFIFGVSFAMGRQLDILDFFGALDFFGTLLSAH